jgi:Deoxyribonuclease NucA/NucB
MKKTSTFLTIFASVFCAATGPTAQATPAPAQAAVWTVCGAYDTWQEAYDAWVKEGKPRRADADGDGIPCESLPGAPSVAPDGPAPSEEPAPTEDPSGNEQAPEKNKSCKLPKKVVSISFSKTKYPNIKAHTERAIAKGQPRILKLNRKGADERRRKLLENIPTKKGYDRDEYSPAFARKTWKADVEYVPSSENRSHGSVMGKKLSPYCDGTRFKYVWY